MGSTVEGRVALVPVVAPFRLDLTVAVLQRVPTNPVEVWTVDGRYLRAFEAPSGPLVWEVTAETPMRGPLRLSLHRRVHVGDARIFRPLLGRMLGCDVDLSGFYAIAAEIPVLAKLADRFRGVKPPRFASLWESLVSAIAFQQLSLVSGMAAMARLARQCMQPVLHRGRQLYPFPGAQAVQELSENELRACGFSVAKARALKAAAAAILDGALREDELERLPDDEVAARLCQLSLAERAIESDFHVKKGVILPRKGLGETGRGALDLLPGVAAGAGPPVHLPHR